MKPDSPLDSVVSLRSAVILIQDLPDLECWNCPSTLDLHQPDENRPEHLLGTCPICGNWYLIGSNGDDIQLIVVELPDVQRLNLSLLLPPL